MTSYILKRLMLMLVTLFGISMIQFTIINMMPGRPSSQVGQASSSDMQNADSLTTESDRKWRASYKLDKPTIVNTRPWMKQDEVLKLLNDRLDGTIQEKTQASYELDDLGASAVTFLVNIANDSTQNVALRHLAIKRLPDNIQQQKKLLSPDVSADSKEYKETMEKNRLITLEDSQAKKHSMKKVREPKLADVEKNAKWWKAWYEKEKSRFEYDGTLDKLGDFFFDTRYAYFMKNICQGNFGETRQKTLVSDEIAERLPVTLTLNGVSFVLIYLLALPIGILGAVRRGGTFDVSSTVVLFLLYSLPTFYIGLILLDMTTGVLDNFPSRGWESDHYQNMTTLEKIKDRSWHSVLPLFCMVYGSLAYLSRFARTSLLDIIKSDYVRTATAKGLSSWVVVMKHALRNGAIPVLTLLGGMLPGLIGGSVIIEVIFGIRGMGLLFFDSLGSQDFAITTAIMFITAVLVLLSLFIVDLLYTVVDPRISYDD